MELSPKSYDKLKQFIKKSKKENYLEFEINFNDQQIDQKKFESVFNKLTFSQNNNGLGLTKTIIQHLDIYLKSENNSRSRMTILDEKAIKKYWLGIELDDSDFILEEKEKIEKYDDEDYHFRMNLSKEIPKETFLEKNISLLKANNTNKYYRLKNRYSIKSPDGLFTFDLTIVKQGFGSNFKQSKTLNSSPKFEIEIEFNNKKETKKDEETILKEFIQYIYLILSTLNDSNQLMSQVKMDEIIYEYERLVDVNKNSNFFIAANPITLHKRNLIKSDEIKNIYNRYGVSLKADGERFFAYVNKLGIIYYFNNNKNVLFSGYSCKSYSQSLIEGELIVLENKKIFYAYDMLFSKGNDVRRKLLVSLRKKDESYDEKLDGRYDMLNKFRKSKDFKEEKSIHQHDIIEFKIKPIKFSLKSDGSDIFEKSNELWSSRAQNEFEVDGMIYTPIYTHYPMKGGKWDYLFKWKPPHLNSVDFLVKFMKDENGVIINSPHIDNVKRIDKKVERQIKIYRTLELYVGGMNYEYNNKFKRMMSTIKPILYNPLRVENVELNENNSSKIFIDGSEKIYSFDPITKVKEEINDDTIVEFAYNVDESNGFQWTPIRVRHDKTNQYKEGKPMYGNNEKTANDIFISIKNPVTEEMITTGQVDISNDPMIGDNKSYWTALESTNENKKKRYPFQNFHNLYIKNQLFYISSPTFLHDYSSGQHGKILDGCSGKGVDIIKIRKANYAEVVGIEIDEIAVQHAQNYYKTSVSRPKPKAFYVRGDMSKLIFPNQSCAFTESGRIYTKKFIPNKHYFDTMCLMFCVHYFFKNEISLRTIIQNINDSLKINGYIIGTCFDGANLYKLLQNKSSISGKTFEGETMWKIDKAYKGRMAFGAKNANLGKEIDVFVQTIGYVHKEYLVNFAYFEKIMNEYGFEKIIIKPFEDFYNELKAGENIMNMDEQELSKMKGFIEKMSDVEKEFSFLSSAFIFKKVEHSSDSLFSKLVGLMEKEEKKVGIAMKVSKEDEGVIVANEEI